MNAQPLRVVLVRTPDARGRLVEHLSGNNQAKTSIAPLTLIVGIRAAGLAAGPMTGFDAAALDADFFPDGRHRSLVVVNVGHPAPDASRDRLPRLEYEDVVSVA
jgi:3-hydroxypropanoate dehydrogenase